MITETTKIPDEMREKIGDSVCDSIENYANLKIATGGFLRAVLENNLSEACQTADAKNLANLHNIVNAIYWELPADCWGTRERVNKWLKKD
jgi:hypothetical protein